MIMKTRNALCLVALLGLLLPGAAAAANAVYLRADFDDKTIDAPIGTGGAAVGEPTVIENGVAAIVRQGPMGSPSLEIQDMQEGGDHVCFQFESDAELTAGEVYVGMNLWFDSLAEASECNIRVFERGGQAKRFAELGIIEDGGVYLHYGEASSAGIIGQAVVGRLYRVVFAFNMDAGTFSVWLDGVEAASGLPHGITDRGIGSVLIGCDYDDDAQGSYNVDALEVTDFQIVPIENQTWGRIKTMFRERNER
jgi:hypothetical protein